MIGGKAQVEAKSISRLKPGVWLNDEIVNAYVTMLQARADADDTLPSVHVFNSFFYAKMESAGYNKMLARWTKKVRPPASSWSSVPFLFSRVPPSTHCTATLLAARMRIMPLLLRLSG